MIWLVVMQVFSTLLELIQIGRLNEQESNLELLVLREQLAIVDDQLNKPLRLSRAGRLVVAVVGAKLKATTERSLHQLRGMIRIVRPETVFRWHRELARRTCLEIEQLIVRLAHENVDWGYGKIQGELLKLGHDLSEETIANILERYGTSSNIVSTVDSPPHQTLREY